MNHIRTNQIAVRLASPVGRLLSVAVACAALLAPAAQAQKYPITQQQRAIAQQVAARGIPVRELKADAPSTYTVRRGDTLWAISGMYLHRPWRWPALWGMNMDTVRNPHLIYPGQVLHLDVRDGYARLGLAPGGGGTIKLSPTVRAEPLSAAALPTVRRDLIEPFLVRPFIKSLEDLSELPDIVASVDERLVMGNGDLIYVRGTDSVPLAVKDGAPRNLAIFRKAKPLQDPQTKEILGYEGEYVGQARIVRDEYFVEQTDRRGRVIEEYRPATLEITSVATDVRVGDRLDLINEEADYDNFVPRLPAKDVEGRVVALYGDQAVKNASSGQVVAINLGREDAIEKGHVLQILRQGRLARDPERGRNARIRLPDEPNGVLLIFRVFDRVSYGLIMDTHDPVSVGDKLVVPE
ncbi:peptidoglycan-binding protein [Vandammella animalimorsus]|uniref:LysM peptidoglycan-binding domain-containing protein n=1 Tax=Vandammella animalimorsus TaxID=2029117 RepID=A0A2A2APX2_9BURK|nr:LysM peptidoglycan-binding domain-containing protein [Vandammella animalimorsus]PAT39886.1 peptidoglycan-binding protein [Vandammella animalimorsus]RMX15250.1 LysM peptidoglycan-binding domain-containing protein [Vandammella animalimorsus]